MGGVLRIRCRFSTREDDAKAAETAGSRSASAQPLSACLDSVDSSTGRRRVAEFLRAQPYPHYEPAPGGRGLLVRIEAGGKRTVGRFVNRKFQAVKSPRR
jgi:hypothetical protein